MQRNGNRVKQPAQNLNDARWLLADLLRESTGKSDDRQPTS
jgi:hypothetical protein